MKERIRYSRQHGNPQLLASQQNACPANRSRGAFACEISYDQWLMQRRSRARRYFAFLVFATIVFLASTSFAQAPAHRTEKLDLQKPAINAMEQAHKEGVTKQDLSPQWDKFPAFEAYYKRLIFGKFKDDAYLGELGAVTQTLIEDMDKSNRARTPAAALVRGYALDIGKAVAPNPYHPIARINATMLLALADDAPENPAEKKPPVPAAAAFVPLVQLYNRADSPDGVRAVALQGIARHVTLGAVTSPQFRSGVAKMMMQLATTDAPPGRSPEAHAFMQRYAVDILAVLANPNTTPDTAKTLVALSTNNKKPSLIAAYAASKMSTLQPGKQKLPELPSVLKEWAARAAATFDGEIARIAKLDPPAAVNDQPAMPTEDTVARGSSMEDYMASGMSMEGYMPDMSAESMGMGSDYEMMMGMGMMPGMVAVVNPQPLEVISARRRVNHVLQQLQLGVTGQVTPGVPEKPAGLFGIADPADKAAVEAWIKTVSEVTTAINANTLDSRKKFVEELAKQSEALKKLAGVASPAAPAAGAMPGMPPMPGQVPPAVDAGLAPPAANAAVPPAAPPAMNPPVAAPPVPPAAGAVAPPAPGAAPAAAPVVPPAAAVPAGT